jgi:thioredoxin reductase (NADPH)
MPKPVLLAVDDDSDVLRAVERDLRSYYAEKYRVHSAGSGARALDLLRELQQRDAPVALLLVDQRMPGMTGVAFLGQAMRLYPDARRVLITAYADTEAAIRAINEASVHYYLPKPWDPPDEHLYPVLDDLLNDWQQLPQRRDERVRVLGHRWSPEAFAIRSFLAGQHVEYRWLDVERADVDPEVRKAVEAVGGLDARLPQVLIPTQPALVAPSTADLAARLGLQTRPGTNVYDLAIIGAGPAGLAAAVYGASEGLKTVAVERTAPGGQASYSARIENYLGFPGGISGAELAQRSVDQARDFEVELLTPQEAVKIRTEGDMRIVKLSDGCELTARTLLLATGVRWRTLDVPGVDELIGAGVYYGSAPFEAKACSGGDVYVVGGANSAAQAALYLSLHARKVTMLCRSHELSHTMSRYLFDRIDRIDNITVEREARVVAAYGNAHLESIDYVSGPDDSPRRVPATALFIMIGAEPHTNWLDGVVERDERGFILSGSDLMRDGRRPRGWTLDRDPWLLETSVPGVFVVGDVRKGSVKRVASSVGEGAVAIQFVHQYLSTQ